MDGVSVVILIFYENVLLVMIEYDYEKDMDKVKIEVVEVLENVSLFDDVKDLEILCYSLNFFLILMFSVFSDKDNL